jgi:poly(hydroxyalkanoate) depolymerase family esterase
MPRRGILPTSSTHAHPTPQNALMTKRSPASAWAKAVERSFVALARSSIRVNSRVAAPLLKAGHEKRKPPAGDGDWLTGMAMGPSGARRYRLYRPPAVQFGERLPLVVMLHGCGQDAKSFAESTRMNRIASRERFFVLYPEQDRLSNAHGCWNWFDTRTGRAYGEAELIMGAIDQVCMLYRADNTRVAIAGLSAGASMAALLATRHPARFKAVMMHSGIPPGTAHSGASALGAMRGMRRAKPLPAPTLAAPRPWPPLLVIHGARDRVVSGSNAGAAARTWAEAAGAREADGRPVQRGKRYPMTVTDFKVGRKTVAALVEVDKLGHAWSGGAARHAYSDGQGPDASRMMWAFAARQFAA